MFPLSSDEVALRFKDRTLTHTELANCSNALAHQLQGLPTVAVWATPTIETCVAVVAALKAGVPAVPLNPKVGERELAHIVADSAPANVLAAPGTQLPAGLDSVPRRDVTLNGSATEPLPEPAPEAPALIVYTSGTTGSPKGVVLPRRAIVSTLDAVAEAWEWTSKDVLVHALPLFHVHGLILGVLGPLRRGGTLHHLGRFSTDEVSKALKGDGTMLFGVPTMYHRIAEEVQDNADLSNALGQARLLVSGSAALPTRDHERIADATGQRVVERYGMTETLMNTSVRADGDRRPGTVGVPLPGVEVRLVDDNGGETTETGEIQVRGPNLFTEYLNRPDATAEAFDQGWFRTGDVGTRDPDGYYRIVGRKATDIIKSGGYKIGAGEIENALLEHPAVREVAVTGEPDDDLGERIIAWVVPAGTTPDAEDLVDHVARLLTPHKRPRLVRFVESLPRNDMGKVMKRALRT
ncbi:acyl-CoA synthetase [Lentzea sp. NPDC051838]|uniref:acyl-CoA synthetase n=1 Tax=Lentzea sp. NPDC051838 TaxID=3154849 RepID=UPI00342A323C